MHQVFEIAAVRKRCVDLLRKDGGAMTAGAITVQLGLPFWAVLAGLYNASDAGEAKFVDGTDWQAIEGAPL